MDQAQALRDFVAALNADVSTALQEEEKNVRTVVWHARVKAALRVLALAVGVLAVGAAGVAAIGGLALAMMQVIGAALLCGFLVVAVIEFCTAVRSHEQLRERLTLWRTPLADSGNCARMDELVATHPNLALLPGIGRELYVADYLLAQVQVQEYAKLQERQARELAERIACARLHGRIGEPAR